uniref:leucine-rich repeat protein 1-like n=1 Tax=Styela clava TaxID=7725 RepID=UPI00193A65A4|nr:leucine-rich repeat protein 1-like [Styela clava]
MRLVCSVASINLEAASRGFGANKGVRSTLSVFKKEENTFLMWCTTKNKHGSRYKLHNNVEKIFSRMLSEGKATIRLKDPHLDLCVSGANSIDLQRLVNAIKVASTGQSLLGRGVLSSAEPVQNRVIQKPKTKLMVNSKQRYPLLEGFPSTLEQLAVEHCSLLKLDSRMLKLRHLKILNLSNNKIKTLPDSIAEMQSLVELNLENNDLSELPNTFSMPNSKLCSSLRCLKLNTNQIKCLPPDFGNLCELYQLHIRSNKLKLLPRCIGRLQKLKVFLAPDNLLRILPASIKCLSLEQIDLSGNDFLKVGSIPPLFRLKDVASLQDLTARVIIKKRLPYDEESLTHFCREFIEGGRCCWRCSLHCFESYIRTAISFNIANITHTVVRMDNEQAVEVPIDCIMCSLRCYQGSRLAI